MVKLTALEADAWSHNFGSAFFSCVTLSELLEFLVHPFVFHLHNENNSCVLL